MIQNILLITNCSKKKKDHPTISKLLYQGQFFKGVVNFSDVMGIDLWILSAKYGLIPSTKFIEPYDKTLSNNKNRIYELQSEVSSNFETLLNNYDKIFLLMSRNYLNVFEKYLDHPKVSYILEHRGIGGYNQIIKILNDIADLNKKNIFQMITREKQIDVTILREFNR